MSTALTLISPLKIFALDFIRHPLMRIGFHWGVLALMNFPNWVFIGPLILAMTYVPARRVCLISLLNLLFVAVTGSLLSFSIQTVDTIDYVWPPPWVSGLGKAEWWLDGAIFASFALFYFVSFEAFARLKWIRYPVTAGLLVVAGLALAVSALEPATLLRGVLIGLLFAITRVFWPICYQLSETDILRRVPFFVHLGTLNSPWQAGWASNTIARGYSDYTNFAAHDAEKFHQTQLSGLRLAVFAGALQVSANLFSDFFFGREPLSPFSHLIGTEFSTFSFLAGTLPRPYAWLFVFSYTFYFLISLAAFTHAAVSIARMCGFDVFRNVYRPLEANSFNGFLSRIYFYYIAILQRFFFYPIWRALRGIGDRHLRTFVTVLLTIFFGGMVTTTLRYIPLHVEEFTALGEDLRSRLAYFLLLGLVCAISALSPVWPSYWERAWLKLPRGLFYFAIYALCYCAQMRTVEFDGFSGLRGLAYLFGF